VSAVLQEEVGVCACVLEKRSCGRKIREAKSTIRFVSSIGVRIEYGGFHVLKMFSQICTYTRRCSEGHEHCAVYGGCKITSVKCATVSR
jgi:hypothetical protein